MHSVPLLAHQGGWDEFLLVAGPIAVIFFMLRVAKKRADAIRHDQPSATDGST